MSRRANVLVLCAFFLPLIVGILIAQDTTLSRFNPKQVAKGTGASGLKWIGGSTESPLMYPGRDCIACHARGEGPTFAMAGTVYAKFDEKDDDFGFEGAKVVVTDAKGATIMMVTNAAGNFMSSKSTVVAMPYTAKVVNKGQERAMFSPQSTGNCMSCHTAEGRGGAPGRIAIP